MQENSLPAVPIPLTKSFQVTKIKREMYDFIANPKNGTLEQKAEAVSEQVGKLLELKYMEEAFWRANLLKQQV
jgi:hypothetical protein